MTKMDKLLKKRIKKDEEEHEEIKELGNQVIKAHNQNIVKFKKL
jgi:hypothetical protein